MKQNARSYGEDIAYIHHAGFTRFANAAAPPLIAILRAHRITSGTIVDLGCGTGVLTRHLVDARYDVIGIDISDEMLRIARKNVPEARFRRASLLRTSIPRCSAVLSIGECLNYVFDRRNNAQQRAKLFRRISRALNPGGIFVFDVATISRGARRAPYTQGRTPSAPTKVFSAGKDWVIATEIMQQGNQLSRKIVSARKIDKSVRLHHEIHRQLLFDSNTLKRELNDAGFQVKVLLGYGSLRLDATHRAFICHIRGYF